MNFGEIVDAAIAQVVGVTQTERLVDTSWDFVAAMVNKGYHIVERAALWKFSEKEAEITAVPNVRECPDLPEDFSVSLAIWSPRIKGELHYHDERQRFFPLADKGAVELYGLWGGDLRFYPTPRQAESFTLRYYARWLDLRQNTDEPVFPETFHDLLVDYGSYHLALRLPPTGDRYLPYSHAQPYSEAFNASLQNMLNSDLVLKTFDEVPNYDYIEQVLGAGDW